MSHLNSPVHSPARRAIEDMLDRLDPVDAPVVSLYLDVHAGTDPNAPAQRADAALRALDLDRRVREDLERRLGEALRSASEGTLAFFAAQEPDGWIETHLLQIAPPVPGGAAPAVARRGTPWTEPLQLLLASDVPVVAVFADARRARVFVHDLGEIVEASSYVRALDPSNWRRYEEAKTGTPGEVARGGSGRDDFEARKDAWTERFVSDVIEQIALVVAARGGTRLVLLGETRQRRDVEAALPAPLKTALLASGPAPVDPDLATSRWVEPLSELIRTARHGEDELILAEIEQHGVVGVQEVLDALQKGDLQLVAVPADVDVDVVHCLGTDWLAASEEEARRVCPDGPIDRAPLKHFLLGAVQRGRARLRVLRGPDANDLVTRVGPLAGLPRRT